MKGKIRRVRAVFAQIDRQFDRLGGADFLPEGRPPQPPSPEESIEDGLFDLAEDPPASPLHKPK